jgi:N-acyl-D-aspartate/D-glutamate deacylase
MDLSYNPLTTLPSYRAIADKPLAEKVAIMRDPAFKAKVLAEEPIIDPVPFHNHLIRLVPNMFVLGKIPNYSPPAHMKIGEQAKRLGVYPMSLVYDLMLEDDGHAILYLPRANFTDGNLAVARQMLVHPDTILGLGDGGAHYGIICDAGYPTFMLTYWVREAPEDQRVPLEWTISELTRRPAQTVGLMDRGVVAPGYKADLNVIDLDRLTLYSPQPVYNLPAGGRRLQQKADGYVATIVNGEITYRDGEPTGRLPGRLVRGDGFRPRPRAAA